MAQGIFIKGTNSGSGGSSSDCTSLKNDVLLGKTAITKDSNDNIVDGSCRLILNFKEKRLYAECTTSDFFVNAHFNISFASQTATKIRVIK